MTLELSKVPLIPPDPTTLPVGGRLGYFHLNWKFLGAHPSVIKTLEFGLQLPIGSVRIPLSRVPLINSHYSSLEKNLVLCQAVVDMLLKGAIQEVRDSSSLAFYSRLFLVAKKTGGWRPVIDLSHLNLYLDFPTFRMETTQSIRNSLQVGQWTTSLDLKDAYFHVPMAPTVHKLLRFQVLGKVYQFVAMPFGLATAPKEGQVPVHSGGYSSSAFQPPYYSTPGYAPFGSTSFHREVSTSGSPSYATPSISSQEKLQLPPKRCPGFSIHLGPFSEGSSKVVVTEEQCHGASCTAPTQVCNIHLHGCLSSGLGSSLCSHDCPRSLVDSAVQTAHQCSGAQSCAPGSQDFCTSVIPSSKDYSGSLRQHHCLCLHKQTRGHPLLGPVCPDLASVCLLSQEQGCSYSKTCSRGHESCGRPTLQVSTDPSYRVVPQSQDLQVAVTNRLPTSNRSFCNKIQSQASPVCFSSARSQGSGSRCPGDELVRTSSLLLPSYSSLSTCGQEVNQLSELQDASCGPSLGNQRVASRSIGTVNKKTNRSSSKRKSLKATSSRGVSSKSKESKPSCLLAEVSLEKKGFSQEVTSRILSPIRKSSKSVYEAKWNGFCTWCEEHGFSAMHPTVPIIAEFFLFLFSEKKLLPQTIEGYRSALSMKLDADLELGSNKELKRLIQSFYKSRPKTSRHIPSWDLTLVLQALTKAPFEPLSLAEPKFLTWKTVFLIALASGRRRSEIHAFTFKGCSHSKGWSKVILKTDPAFLAKNQLASEGASIFSEIEIPALTKCLGQQDTEDRSLCPVRALRHYLSRTSDLRQGRSLLFVSLLKSKQGDIAAQTISNWIKDLIHFTLKNCSTENASLHGVKAHDVRAQAASWSFKGGIPLLDIMRSCTWKSHSTFTSFYFRNVALKNLEDTYRLGDIVAAQRVVSLST